MPRSATLEPPQASIPELVAGDRLDQKTFHARYEAMPEHVKAELIEGIVYMAAAQRNRHGSRNTELIGWLRNYKAATPGVHACDNSTTILGDESEPQPDACLLVLPEYGGRCRFTPDDYLEGPPELVAETALSSESIDLHAKLRDYERAGVKECLVLALRREEVYWCVRRRAAGPFVRLSPGSDGVFRSPYFGGLWLDAGALFRLDSNAVDATLNAGLASPEHAKFAATLARRKK